MTRRLANACSDCGAEFQTPRPVTCGIHPCGDCLERRQERLAAEGWVPLYSIWPNMEDDLSEAGVKRRWELTIYSPSSGIYSGAFFIPAWVEEAQRVFRRLKTRRRERVAILKKGPSSPELERALTLAALIG